MSAPADSRGNDAEPRQALKSARSYLAHVLPDITVFGPYTYLVTEILWGSVALALLSYAGAFRTAAWTTAVLYPPALLWDWYTLRVGVFEIPMRTGVELLGVPIEEHIFMLVVPAMVVGTHETLRKLRGDPGEPVEPVESAEPGEPVEPVESAEPGESAEATSGVETDSTARQ